MPRIKQLNPERLGSGEMLSLSDDRVRMLMVYLFALGDDDGIVQVSHAWIRTRAYAGRKVSDSQIDNDIAELENAGLVYTYSVMEKRYLIPMWVVDDHKPDYPVLGTGDWPPEAFLKEHPNVNDFLQRLHQKKVNADERRKVRKLRTSGAVVSQTDVFDK